VCVCVCVCVCCVCVRISVTALLSFYGSLAALSLFFFNLTSFVLLLDRSESMRTAGGYVTSCFTTLTMKCQVCLCCTVTHILNA